MSISDNYVPLRQIGNGVTTQFSASWNMIAAAYALVYLEDAVTGVQTAVTQGPGAGQYQFVSLTGSGWTIQFGTAPTAANYVVVGRNVAQDQTDPYRTSKGFQGDVLEASLDKLTAMIQDQGDAVARALQFPLGDTGTGLLPSVQARKGLSLIFNAVTGVPEVGAIASAVVSAAMIPVLAAGTLAAARAAMGAASSGANSDITSMTALVSVNGGQLAGLRNRIINGACGIQQRVAVTTGGGYTYGLVDKWLVANGGTATAGTTTSFANTTTSLGTSVAVTGYSSSGTGTAPTFQQRIELRNCLDLNSKTVAVSAWVFHNQGTTIPFVISFNKFGSADVYAGATSIGAATMSVSNVPSGVWTRIMGTYTFGAADCSNGISFGISGSTNVTFTANTIAISDAQLEVGGVITPFESRSIQLEQTLCERYFRRLAQVNGYAISATNLNAGCPLSPVMRAAPTHGQNGVLNVQGSGNPTQSGVGLGSNFSTTYCAYFNNVPNLAGMTANQPLMLGCPGTNSNYITLDADL